MHTESIAKWQHTHIFGQDQIRSGERRTLIVIMITSVMMVVEIIAGLAYGSMALFADGIHMGSHMVGLGISFVAYIYARKHAYSQQFSFGTGKVNALAGYSSAIFWWLLHCIWAMRVSPGLLIQWRLNITRQSWSL
jgi:cation diffusion facilitator family transporter